MAVHEALYSFANRSFYPEVILLSSQEYNSSSIDGDLVRKRGVKDRLSNFVDRIIVKVLNLLWDKL